MARALRQGTVPLAYQGSETSFSTPEELGTLLPHQWFYRGLVFGEGTDVLVDREVTGAWETKMRSGDRVIPRGDGAIQGDDFAQPGMIVLPLRLLAAPNSDAMRDLMRLVNNAFAITPGSEHWLYGYFGGDLYVGWRGRTVQVKHLWSPRPWAQGAHRHTVALKLSDPRRYDPEVKSALLPLFASQSGGLDLPIPELPTDFDQPVSSIGQVTNDGNTTAWPEYRFSNPGPGDVTDITLTNLTTAVKFQWIGGATPLAAGQTLVADMDALVRATTGPFVYIDAATRYSQWQLPREPLGLVPGINQFTLQATGAEIQCRATWRDTWL